MDALSFIAQLVQAAAWPVAIVVLALMFRPQLRALLERLNKGRLGPAEFEFERALRVLSAQSGRHASAAPAVLPYTGSARAAILAAWRDLAQAAPADLQPLSAADKALYQQLGALREQAHDARDFHPSAESVSAYVQLARSLQASLQRAR